MGLDRTCLPVLVNNTSTSHEAFKPVSFQCQLWVTFRFIGQDTTITVYALFDNTGSAVSSACPVKGFLARG